MKRNDVIDLGLVHRRVQSRWKRFDSGAGANANAKPRSRVDMLTFVGSDPLAELVWSPQHGLSVNSFPDSNRCCLWDMGPSQGQSRSTCCVDGEVAKGPGSVKTSRHSDPGPFFGSNTGKEENAGEVSCVEKSSVVKPVEIDGRNKGKEKECLMVETSKGARNREATSDSNGNGNGLGLNVRLPLKNQAANSPSSSTKHAEKGKAKMDESGWSRDPKDAVLETVLGEASSSDSRICTFRDRETSSYCREHDGNRGDDSHGSVESCNTGGGGVGRKRRWSFEQKLILGSKRIKNRTRECPVPVPRPAASSFVNWISNMVKGLPRPNPDVVHDALALSVAHPVDRDGTTKPGFQTMFRSMISSDPKPNPSQAERETVAPDEAACRSRNDDPKPTGPAHDGEKANETGDPRSLWVSRVYPRIPSAPSASHHSDPAMNDGSQRAHEDESAKRGRFVSKDAPKGMFDIVRKLRLSRTDIHKWANSQFSYARLDGFFVRLRLAKWEAKVGGAGYYVAFITGSQGDESSKGTKKPIRVDVGGVECLVESRYVSNCDFLEDELAAWWHKTSANGRVPTMEDLKAKVEERKKLGL